MYDQLDDNWDEDAFDGFDPDPDHDPGGVTSDPSTSSFALEIDMSDIFRDAAIRIAALKMIEDWSAEIGETAAIAAVSHALIDAGYDPEFVTGSAVTADGFAGYTEIDSDSDEIISRSGTIDSPEGRHYIIEVGDAEGGLVRILDVLHDDSYWSEDDLASVDWDTVATELREFARQLPPALEARSPDEPWEAVPSECVRVAGEALGGVHALLADVAESFLDHDMGWREVDNCIDRSIGWCELLRNSFTDRYLVKRLIEAGLDEPAPQALDALREADAQSDKSAAGMDDDNQGNDDDNGNDGGEDWRPSLADTILLIPGESEAACNERASRQTGIPAEAIVWARSSDALSELALLPEALWVGTRNGPVVFDPVDGAILDNFLASDASFPSWMGAVDDVLLAQFDDRVFRLDLDSARAVWSHEAGSGVATDGHRLLIRRGGEVVAGPTTVTCVELRSGEVLWEMHGRGSRPGLFPIGFGRGFAWLSQRIEDTDLCIGVDEKGRVQYETPIGGTAQGGHVLGDALVTGYRWTWLADVVANRAEWLHSPYPVAANGQAVLWYEDGRHTGSRFWFGNGSSAQHPIPGTEQLQPHTPGGLAKEWVSAAGAFFSESNDPALHILDPNRGAGRVQLAGYVRGGPISDGDRLWLVCQASLGSSWLLCLDATAVLDAAFPVHRRGRRR